MTVLRRDYEIETRRAIIRKYGSYALGLSLQNALYDELHLSRTCPLSDQPDSFTTDSLPVQGLGGRH